VYYPETTAKWKTFLMTFAGLFLSFAFVNILGVGLGTGVASNQDWSDAYAISSGALILAGYNGVGNFGKFCGVVVALGVIANNIPGTYSAALGFQMLGRYPKMMPRWFWTCIVVLIYFVCALAGRENLFTIFQNFLALMGYWVTTFISVVVEEHLIFRRKSGFDWTAWEDQKRLPIGFAALTAFLIGWAGAIISMYQVYFTGPLAVAVGPTPADVGIWIGCAFTLLTYPPLRYLELKFIGR
jgi:purine-cytosine permease-like protein